jgi:hypothetical protein
LAGSSVGVNSSIHNTSDDVLYRRERIWSYSATPGYRFTVPNGQYEVTLKFAETYWNLAGRRKFDVRIQDATVLSGYDIFADAGGKNIAAPDQIFAVTVSDGQLRIDFLKLANSDLPKINAIQVRSANSAKAIAPTATSKPPSLPLTPTPTNTRPKASPTRTRTSTSVPPTPTRVSTSVPPTNVPPTNTPIAALVASTPTPAATRVKAAYEQRVNAGGMAYTDSAGKVWATDHGFVTDGWGYLAGSTFGTASTIAKTNNVPLYQTERIWSDSTMPGYRFTVPNGQYEVTLKFAETYWTLANRRKFDVRIEGLPMLSGYDIFADAGGKNVAAPDKVFTVSVTDGHLDIDFIKLPNSDLPKVNAIQVLAK